jgi:methylisocitrate lyase
MTAASARDVFVTRAKAGRTVWAAGVHDCLSALLAQEAGFEAVMTGGLGISASLLGKPDAELLTLSENMSVLRNVARAVSIPVLADIDTGYGNAINAMRSVEEAIGAGAAGVIIEDQISPKRCPVCVDEVQIVPAEEAAGKIRAAVQARGDAPLAIVARTDAADPAEACARARMYVAAGADLIQPISKTFRDFAGLAALREAAGAPLSLQVLGWLETGLSPEQIGAVAGLATFPLVGLMTMAQALRENFAALAGRRTTADLPRPRMASDDFTKFIGFPEIEALQQRFMPVQP